MESRKKMVRPRRLELPYPCECQHLKLVRLPISPRAHSEGTFPKTSHSVNPMITKLQNFFTNQSVRFDLRTPIFGRPL